MMIDQQKDLLTSLLSDVLREANPPVPAVGPVTITHCTISTINVICREPPQLAKEP